MQAGVRKITAHDGRRTRVMLLVDQGPIERTIQVQARKSPLTAEECGFERSSVVRSVARFFEDLL